MFAGSTAAVLCFAFKLRKTFIYGCAPLGAYACIHKAIVTSSFVVCCCDRGLTKLF